MTVACDIARGKLNIQIISCRCLFKFPHESNSSEYYYKVHFAAKIKLSYKIVGVYEFVNSISFDESANLIHLSRAYPFHMYLPVILLVNSECPDM